MSDYIEIGHERTCDCKPTHLSCLDGKNWLKSQIGVWEFAYEARDIRDKSIHPATFPIAMARQVIELFTHRGELVVDPFVGSGTTLVAAQDAGRNAIGFDLQRDYVELSRSRLISGVLGSQQLAVCEDARNISNLVAPGTVKLVFTSPPYANMLNRVRKNRSRRGTDRLNDQYGRVEQYSQDERDLGTLDARAFEAAIGVIFSKMKKILTEKAHVVINITDIWMDKKRVPLHINLIRAMETAGYEFRNTIIWDRRNLVNKAGIFGYPYSYITMQSNFEYILDFTL